AVARTTVVDASDRSAWCGALRECDALLVRTSAVVDADVLSGATRLKVIGRGGAGLDNIDLAAASRRGIVVVHTPEAATEAVADLTVGLMIAVIRDIVGGDRAVRAGRFHDARAGPPASELRDLTLGIVGLGRIGRAVARRCRRGFSMRVVYNDIVPPGRLDFDAVALEKRALYARADVVSLHVPLTPSTRRMIDAAALRGFKRSAILINTARGGVVDGDAVAEALRAGALAGAALDVVEPEPLPDGHPLVSAPHVLLTPHIGARTATALAGMNDVVDDVLRVLRGEPPRFPADTA
ncbi:MAG: 2-hydroxyacid dehydrogenase, partial [Phycisphaerae bacterium]